ncbi:MAG: DUF1367 family protein [Candidatus Micrarchaeota archaeon]|nr:DUF1367 family protein [Candidatus Micrarchaeota archaeon]
MEAEIIHMRIYLKKQLSGAFTPDDEHSAEIARKFKVGEVVRTDVHKERNLKFLRKYFALLATAFDNQEQYTDFDEFREEVTIQSGYYTLHHGINGEITKRAKSISFSRMDELEFCELYQRTIDALITHFIPGTDPAALDSAVSDILGFA